MNGRKSSPQKRRGRREEFSPRRATERHGGRGERGVEKIGGGDWGDCVGWFQAASGWHLDQERATPRAVLGPQDTGKQSLASGTRKRGRREEFSPRRATERHGGKRGERSGDERRRHRGIEPLRAAIRGVASGSEVSHATGHGKEIHRRDAEDAEKSFYHGGPRRSTEERGERGVVKRGEGIVASNRSEQRFEEWHPDRK